ncbi:M13 family metallopeptidase [Sulfurovum riftiae]|uniref:Peptidase M13 n=1 Tax=Sulfurovum riftiae TaxID=1630136 RepID=A0A151CDX2_9BACT|nr:M13 family metallopeptidase [Sulfurovum riftiae]KYJ85716.1 hypothetical protein AS592_02970 [Sulfurovum riftiae]
MKKNRLIFPLLVAATLSLTATDNNTTGYKENFYKAVNQPWISAHKIADDKNQVSTFTHLDDLFVKNGLALIEKIKKKKQRSVEEQKVLDYYTAFSDMKGRNAKCVTPIEPIFKRIDAIKDHKELAHLMADLAYEGTPIPYGFGPVTDREDATRYVILGMMDGMTLPKKFYEDNSTASQKKIGNYTDYLRDILTLARMDDVNRTVENDMKVERLLASHSLSVTQLHDVKLTNNPSDFKSVEKMLSNLDIAYYFKKMGLPQTMKLNIASPDYFRALNENFKKVPLPVWKDYLKTEVLGAYAGSLSEPFIEAAQRYNIKEGQATKLEPLEIRALRNTSAALSFLFGKLYVDAYFDDADKAKIEKILHSILDTYRTAIKESDRLAPSTKKAALEKLDKMAFNIAYPNKWRDYTPLKVKSDDLIYNVRELVKFGHLLTAEKIKKGKVDKEMWESSPPQEANAFYSPNSNKFILLAGILHAPIFDANATDAANYGGIGLVIAHEIGHAFDNSGAMFDGDGNMKNWWTKEDYAAFEKLKQKLIAQANRYEVISGVHANGALEIGEIIADLSGAEIALRAYLSTLDKSADKNKGMRDFFIQYAKVWKANTRPQVLVMYNDTDGHPASEYRINGTVKNMDAFYEAFGVKEGDGMYLPPGKRVEIW